MGKSLFAHFKCLKRLNIRRQVSREMTISVSGLCKNHERKEQTFIFFLNNCIASYYLQKVIS